VVTELAMVYDMQVEHSGFAHYTKSKGPITMQHSQAIIEKIWREGVSRSHVTKIFHNDANTVCWRTQRTSFREKEPVAVSDIKVHEKALLLLVDYTELEQYDPSVFPGAIISSYEFVLRQLNALTNHIKYSHPGEDLDYFKEDLAQAIDGINRDLRALTKAYLARADVGES